MRIYKAIKLSVLLAFTCGSLSKAESFYPLLSKSEARLARLKINPQKTDTAQLNLLIRLVQFHVYKPFEFKEDLDSASFFYEKAKSLTAKLNCAGCGIRMTNLLGTIVHEREQIDQAVLLHDKAIAMSREAVDLVLEGESWYLRGELQNGKETITQKIGHYVRSAECYRLAGNIDRQAYVLKRIAEIYYGEKDFAKALSHLLEALRLYKSIQFPRLHYTYYRLMQTTRSMGIYGDAVRYGLAVIETAKRTADMAEISLVYISMGRLYEELADPINAANYFKEAVAEAITAQNTIQILNGTKWVAKNLLLAGKIKEARAFFSPIFAKYPAYDYNSDIVHLDVNAQYAIATKDFVQAEKYLLAMLKYEDKSVGFADFPLLLNLQIGDFYLSLAKMDKARTYFGKAKALIAKNTSQSVAHAIRLHKALFKLDSAQGYYMSAIAHYQRDRILSDSILTVKKSLQIAGLQIQSDTRKKEQDIAFLTKENKSQQALMKEKDFQRNAMIAGSAMLFVLLLLVYNQYRIKRKSNEAIAQKNIKQEKLIKEKEWLLKEIHHRVKNNLQTIMSLLESQSMNLQSDALNAIKDSQHRVQAMSLIHQKLYLSDNVSTINMQTYVQELVGYLRDSFNTRQRIRFQLEIDPINLDVAQAIPLGLVMNEAITNSIKYAFPGDADGVVKIAMVQPTDDNYELTISDNGIGLPADFEKVNFNSLGLRLIRGLTNEIGGKLLIDGSQGTTLSISFTVAKIFRYADEIGLADGLLSALEVQRKQI